MRNCYMEDCFAYKSNKTCTCLSTMVCANSICNFYKSKSEIDVNEIESAIKNYSGSKNTQ